ncbi:MAG: DUF4357 domain-containing protein [Lactobacillaceae bacterium]|jgi:uncharacterized protein with ParB-like and HNH nuclease domain|nr:DUF4357 domain-containing protein [Lactobacillaceae bacterium]
MDSKPRKLLDEFIPEAIGKQFVIPVYQRKYTWTVKKQLVQLMSDLVKLIEDENDAKGHFLGTIVYLKLINSNYKTERSVVDGQQRLVTMFLIVHAMRTFAADIYRKKELDNTYLTNQAEPKDSKFYQRLYPAVADGKEYSLIASNRYDQLDKSSNSNITQNFLYLQSELGKLIEIYSFDRVLYALKRFEIVYIELDEKDNAQQIFESINSTGERLTASDLMRNFIMMNKSNEEQTELYNKYWQKLEDIFVDSKHMEDFFRYYLAAVTGEYTAKNLLYSAFKNYWLEKVKSSSDEELIKKVVRYAKYFEILYYKQPSGQYKEILSDFQSQESMMPAPFVLEMSEWLREEQKITENQFYKMLEIVNVYQIRRSFNGDDTSRVARAFPTFLKNVKKYVADEGSENFIDIVKYVLVENNKSNNMAMPIDKALKSNMINMNAYAKSKLIRWFLEKLENINNTAKVDLDSLSVEHIMPQTSTPYWEKKAGVSGEEYTELVNTVGNLTLVSKIDNSAAGNKDFETKKKIFEDTLHIQMNKDLYNMGEWTNQSIEERSNKLISELIKMYPYQRAAGTYDDDGSRNIYLNKSGIKAEGYLNEDDTVKIYPGAQVRSNASDIESDTLKEVRDELLEKEIIQEEIGGIIFVQEYIASSPSNAASLLIGGKINGWSAWTDFEGNLIDDTLRKQ